MTHLMFQVQLHFSKLNVIVCSKVEVMREKIYSEFHRDPKVSTVKNKSVVLNDQNKNKTDNSKSGETCNIYIDICAFSTIAHWSHVLRLPSISTQKPV